MWRCARKDVHSATFIPILPAPVRTEWGFRTVPALRASHLVTVVVMGGVPVMVALPGTPGRADGLQPRAGGPARHGRHAGRLGRGGRALLADLGGRVPRGPRPRAAGPHGLPALGNVRRLRPDLSDDE